MTFRFAIILAAVLVHLASAAVLEPPGWWAGHSRNPIRVMVTGRELSGPVVSSSPALKPGSPGISAKRTHVFFDLTISSQARPGTYNLRIGRESLAFEIYRPLPARGRFSGLSEDDVIYLILPDRFANGDITRDGPLTDRTNPRMYHGGDFAGIAERLPYLKELGVTALWIAPIYDNADIPGRYRDQPTASYHGYGAVDLYGVEQQFGDLDSFRTLVDAAHALGLKVILDQVANHVGAEHHWAHTPPTPTWLHGSRAAHPKPSSEMWTLIDPHRSPGLSRRLLEGWFVDVLPDLNQDDPEVERYLIQNTLWWIGRTGIDGIRQDTVPYVPKSFWHKWMPAILTQYPKFQVVGEVFNYDPHVVAHFEDTGFRLFDFPLLSAVRKVFLGGSPLTELPAALSRDWAYSDAQRMVTFFGLHDIERFRQTGSHRALKDAFQFLLTTRGTPLIYYGDEIGMKGAGDPDNRRDFPGGWPGDSRNAFAASGRTVEEQDMFAHVQSLLRLRARHRALRRGKLLTIDANRESYVYARRLAGHASVVVSIGKGTAFETSRAPWLAEGAVVKDSLGSSAVLRHTGDRIEVSDAGVFVIAPTR